MSGLLNRIGGLAVCAVAVFGVMAPSVSAPLVSGATVRAFLGGYSGKMVYLKYGAQSGNSVTKNGRALWYVDFSEDVLVEKKICEYTDCEPRNPIISADGKSIVFNTWANNNNSKNVSYVCPLTQGATATEIMVGAQPHWWVNPATGEEYVYNVRGDIENFWMIDGFWPPCDRINWPTKTCSEYQPSMIIKLANRIPSGSAEPMIPYYANGGRSRNGKYVFASSRPTGVFVVDSLAAANATVKQDYHFDLAIEGCNPSVSPHMVDADVRVMWVNDPHDTIYIAKPTGEQTAWIHKEHVGTNEQWDCPEWSTHPNFAVAAGYDKNNANTYDMYIIRLSDKQQIKVCSGPANYPHLWVDDPSANGVSAKAASMHPDFSVTMRSGILALHMGDLHGARLQVTDLNGRTIIRTAIGNRQLSVPVRYPGAMVMQVIGQNGVVMSKSFINQR